VFPHQVTVQWSPIYEIYVACVPALNAVARGRTPEEAVREVIEEAKDIESTLSEDKTIAD
jgi:predicted RNase H-like HicB family nuclease